MSPPRLPVDDGGNINHTRPVFDIQAFLARTAALASATQRSEATVSKWLFEDANTLKRLRAGRSCRVDTLLRAHSELEKREAALAGSREVA